MAKKRDVKYIISLAEYALGYAPFVEYLPKNMTVKQFCGELSKEMQYHYGLDIEQGIVGEHE